MLLALGLIRSEISGRRTPMPEIVGLLAENEQPIVRKVFRTLAAPPAGAERSVARLPVAQHLAGLPCTGRTGHAGMRHSVPCCKPRGCYDADEQLTGLSQVERRLAASREAAQEDLANRGRNLHRMRGIALGLLVILVSMKRRKTMDVDLIFRIAAVGILVACLQTGRSPARAGRRRR